jgi:predicted enzyme related to lactoylglutathione lyase
MKRATREFQLAGPDEVMLPPFYAELFGWEVDTPFLMRCGIIRTPEPENDGVGASPCCSPMVKLYVQTDDLQASLEKAEKLGGVMVQEPLVIPGGPVLAKFADPRGNVVGLVKGM